MRAHHIEAVQKLIELRRAGECIGIDRHEIQFLGDLNDRRRQQRALGVNGVRKLLGLYERFVTKDDDITSRLKKELNHGHDRAMRRPNPPRWRREASYRH